RPGARVLERPGHDPRRVPRVVRHAPDAPGGRSVNDRRRGILAGLGLAGLALVGALVVMLLWNGGGSDTPEPTVTSPSGIQAYADLDRENADFGDAVTPRGERTRVSPLV